jgi:hypothetical protein
VTQGTGVLKMSIAIIDMFRFTDRNSFIYNKDNWFIEKRYQLHRVEQVLLYDLIEKPVKGRFGPATVMGS